MSTTQCQGKCLNGNRCKKRIKNGLYCHIHLEKQMPQMPQMPQMVKSDNDNELILIDFESFKNVVVMLDDENGVGIGEILDKLEDLNFNYELMKKLNGSLLNKISDKDKKISELKKNHQKNGEKRGRKIQNLRKELEICKEKYIQDMIKNQTKYDLLKEKYDKAKEENSRLYEIKNKYDVIVEFEKMKSEIKKIYNWKGSKFYIEQIKSKPEYHEILNKTFNMSIDEIINRYWFLRNLRNTYSHPIYNSV